MKSVTKRIISICATSTLLIGAAATVTYTWYSHQKDVSASNINIGVSNYAYALKIAAAKDKNFVYNLYKNYSGETFTQMSGDGVDFYRAEFETYAEEEKQYGEVIGHIKLEEGQYYKHFFYQEILLQSNKDIKVYLQPSSFIKPVSLSTRKIGKIYKDYIAGAMRLSLARYNEVDKCYEPFIVWAPNSTYQYVGGSDPEVITDGEVEEKYQIVYGTGLDDVISIPSNGKEIGSGSTSMKPGLTYIWGNFEDNIYLFNLYSNTQKFAVGVWLEGSDRECQEKLSGGKVKMSLKFTAEPIN